MKITKRQIRKIVQEAILKEEPSDYYRDYRAGSISYEEYQQMVRDYERRTGGGSSGRSSYRRKTSYVGADANADKIGAIEAALAKKPNNFLQSILDQLKSGRGLSGKQKGIVRKILKKTDPSAVVLFEAVLVEGNHAVQYAIGYEDARDGLPQNSDDPWYSAGFADYFEGIHDQYEALHQDGITTPPAKAGPMLDERKLRKKIRKLALKEMYHQLYNAGTGKKKSYHQVSDSTKSMAMAAKRKFAKDYPGVKVGIDSREGWLMVNGKKAVNISSSSGRPMQIEDMIDQMKQSYLGHSMNEAVLYVTRGPWGTTVADSPDVHNDPKAKVITIGDMVLALTQAGEYDIFIGPNPEDDEAALNNLMSKHEEGVQGGMQEWDSQVFEDYYDVDVERVIANYATLMNHEIEDVPYED